MGIFIDVQKKLGNFTLNIRFASEAKRIGILGASGCGKSMTLKSIAGIISPDAGTIRIGEQIVFDSGKKINVKPQNRRAGYLFQNYALFPNMTVEQNIAVGLSGSREEKRKRVREMVGKFQVGRSGTTGFRENFPAGSSRGQHWRGSWHINRRSFSWTNHFQPWITRPGCLCATTSAPSYARHTRPPYW